MKEIFIYNKNFFQLEKNNDGVKASVVVAPDSVFKNEGAPFEHHIKNKTSENPSRFQRSLPSSQ